MFISSYVESCEVHDEGITDGVELCGDDRKYRDVDTVELVEASPCTTLTQAREDFPHGLKTFIQRHSLKVVRKTSD